MMHPPAPILTTLIALALLAGGCGSNDTDSSVAPRILRVAFVPQRDQEERYQTAYRVLGDYLERTLGQQVEVMELADANAALEGLRADKVDLCSFSPWPFLLAEQKADAEALLITGGEAGLPAGYHTVFITHPGTGLRDFAELKTRGRELVFSFEEAVSTSGHFVPRAYLHEHGIAPERDFKQVLFSPDSTISILSIKARRLDVAAVSNTGLRRAFEMGRATRDEVLVLAETPPVLSNVLCVRRALAADLKTRLRDALLALPTSEPAQWAMVVRMYSNPVVAYLPASDAIIQPYREMIKNVPGLQSNL